MRPLDGIRFAPICCTRARAKLGKTSQSSPMRNALELNAEVMGAKDWIAHWMASKPKA